MATAIKLPLLGEGVVEAKIGRWLKAAGDRVEKGEPILELETDKVTTELVADRAGTLLQTKAAAGEVLPVGAILAYIGKPDEAPPAVEAAPLPAPVVEARDKGTPVPVAGNGADAAELYTGKVSPVVARMVKEHGLDLAQIRGTGLHGRITKRDVLAYMEELEDLVEEAPAEASPVQPQPQPAPAAPAPHLAPGDTVEPLDAMRRTIAEHMVMSKRTSPHATTVFEFDFSAVARDRAARKEDFARQGVKLTYMAYLVVAVAAALKAFPRANSRWSDAGVVLKQEINIGMATALENGLIVPVIRRADRLNLLGVAHAVQDLAERARRGALQPAEVQGGTFTITNHGASGSLLGTPIINQPQCAILGIGIIEDRVCVVDGMIAIRPRAYVSLSFDHRILDGADADRFVAAVKQTIESWP